MMALPVAYWVVLILFGMGLYCILTERNLIKIAVGLNIMEAGLLLFLVRMAYSPGDRAPLLGTGVIRMADPIPHALTLTAIVIAASTTALLLSFIIQIHRHYGTVDIDEIRSKMK